MNDQEQPSEEASNLAFTQDVTDFAKAVNEKSDVEAASIGWQMLMRAGAEALANPSPTLVWITTAGECEDMGNWAGAEEARKKALELGMEHEHPSYPIKLYIDLASLYRILGRNEEALKHVEAALELSGKSQITPLVVLPLESRLKLDCDNEILRWIRDTAMDRLQTVGEGRIFHHTKARLHLVRAECDIRFGELEVAWEHLSKAEALTGDWGENEFMAGRQAFRARVVALQAKLHAARAEWEQAILAQSEAVARVKSVNSQEHVRGLRTRYRLAETLARFAKHLASGGRVSEADLVREEAWRLCDELKVPNCPQE